MNLFLRDVETLLTGLAETPAGADRQIAAVRTDSRLVGSGDLFFCLEGSRFDGHSFAVEAGRRGAAAVVAQRVLATPPSCPVLMVPDCLAALGRLGAWWRGRTRARVAAVTGTAGKTTVKELLAQVLSSRLRVARNYKNWNNQLGLPMSMLAADGFEDAWVMEVGISTPRDMDELGPMVAPDLAVIHNIGPAHLEGLGDLAGVARAKAALLRHLAPGGTGLVNADYPLLAEAALALRPDTVFFSCRDQSADTYCRFLGPAPEGRGRFLIRAAGEEAEAVAPLCGEHFAENVAATAATARRFGLPLAGIAAALAGASLPDQRFRRMKAGPLTLIDDSYNANPLSMLRAAQAARSMAGSDPLVLVLGDMRELGPGAGAAHEELGRNLRELAPAAVFWRGTHAPDVARGLGTNGDAPPLSGVDGVADFLNIWRGLAPASGVVLVKGSRSCRMEEFVQALAREYKDGGAD